VALKAEALADVVDVAAGRAARTIWAFDDAITAPLAGFRDAADYYERSSSSRFLEGVGVSTLLIHAQDDPFLPARAIPVDPVRNNPKLTLSHSRRGGHVGFVAGSPWRPVFWADAYAARFLAAALSSDTESIARVRPRPGS
jgi:predicted alpha/beta-fold hydrolase